MDLTYRLARQEDAAAIWTVFAESHDDLYKKRGFLDAAPTPASPSPLMGFLIRKTPEAFWVAEDGGKIVGFTDSFVRGSFWFFSLLFISPSHQGQDIGRNLLERTLASWKGVEITNRATMTFAFNPVSQFLYMKYGMYPREPVFVAEAPKSAIPAGEAPTDGLDFEEMKGLAGASETLRRMDESALGFPLDWSHELWFELKGRYFAVKERGETVGYVYVSPKGKVGPVVVESSRHMRPVLEKGLRLAAQLEVEKVSFWMPGSNTHAVDLALKYKMRLDPAVFMSTVPFARWENYVFGSGALM